MTRTKIICTIGPAVRSLEKIMDLMVAGMNVARLNFSHGTHEEHQQVIDWLKEARKRLNQPLSILIDTKGPEIRVGKIAAGFIQLKKGDRLFLVKDKIEGDQSRINIHPSQILDDLKLGMKVLFDDGYIAAHVVEEGVDAVLVEIDDGGILKSGKGINIPNATLNLPAVTEQDIEDIRFGCKNDIDIIAASFVRSADHVLVIKNLLEEEDKSDILILAKIENSEGVQNFDSIVQVADGIMIARGDLGVEVPFSQVPGLQKMMIRKCYLAGKISVTATQMLESMINNPRPTRAEASDVANAIYDGTSAIMLSGETAIGKYPFETVRTMKSIVGETEKLFNYRQFFDYHSSLVYHDVTSSITLAAVKAGYSSNAQAFFVFSSGGSTARLISCFRPEMPIVVLTHKEKTYHQSSIVWGVIPHLTQPCTRIREAFDRLSHFALEQQIVQNGDMVIVTAGSPFGISGTTNMMMVENIGDVLVRGHLGVGPKIHAKVSMALSAESKRPYEVRGYLIILTQCDSSFLPLVQEAAGVILQNHIDDVDSEKFLIKIAKKLGKSILVRADAATKILKEGQLVTLDPEKALIYKGVNL